MRGWKYTHNKEICGFDRQTAQTELLRGMKTSHHSFSTGFTTDHPHGAESVCVCRGAQFYGMSDMSQHSKAQVVDTVGWVTTFFSI